MTAYNALSGTVWEMPEVGGYNTSSTIFVVLDGYTMCFNSVYRRSFNLTTGALLPFGEGSWLDIESKRIA